MPVQDAAGEADMYDPASFTLDGQVAAITGAGAGIGRAIARTFAAAGAAVVVSDLDRGAAEAVAGEIEEAGGQAAALVCDVTQEDDLGDLVRAATERFGKLTTLVSNAVGADPADRVEEAAALGRPAAPGGASAAHEGLAGRRAEGRARRPDRPAAPVAPGVSTPRPGGRVPRRGAASLAGQSRSTSRRGVSHRARLWLRTTARRSSRRRTGLTHESIPRRSGARKDPRASLGRAATWEKQGSSRASRGLGSLIQGPMRQP